MSGLSSETVAHGTCPRCGVADEARRFYGPCHRCRSTLNQWADAVVGWRRFVFWLDRSGGAR